MAQPPAGGVSKTGGTQAHPPGLYVLFGAEAWERFSYYGMRALLTLYLVNHLKYPRAEALSVYGTYTGLVYLTPILGGYLADRFLGRRKAVLIGGALMALGHLAMAFEPLLFVALGLLILGNGFFKPNISTIVGGLYGEGDPRRDGGFTIFYMGINLGAFAAPLVCGTLGEKVGWHYGFSAAAIGMGLGLALFIWGQKWLGSVGMPPRRSEAEARLRPRDYSEVAVWVAAGTAAVWAIVTARGAIGSAWDAVPSAGAFALAALALGVVMFQLFRGSNHEEKQRLAVVFILCVFNIFFWMGFEQAGGTMTLFADKQTDRTIGWPELLVIALAMIGAGINIYRSTRQEGSGRALWVFLSGAFPLFGTIILIWGGITLSGGGRIEVGASQFQAINPLLIVALAPTFSRLWQRLDEGRFRSSTPTKMAIGMVILGLGFVVMFAGQRLAESQGKVGAGWLAAVYALHTIGELCLSPIGLSMVTKLAPARVVSLAMGLWFVSSAVANYLAGKLEPILEARHVPIYGFLVVSSIGPALLLLMLTPILKRWMHGRA